VVGVGADCQYGTYVCQPGLSCQVVCVAPGGAGAQCASAADCQDGLTCPVTSGPPSCVSRSATGQSCDQVACQLGLGCAAISDGGTACEPLVARGACVQGSDGGLCLEAEYCGPDGGCLSLVGIGGSCALDTDCAVGLCPAGTCVLGAAGGACHQGANCKSQSCDSSVSPPACVATCLQ